MLAAEFAVLVHFKSVGVILLVFLCVVVSLLAFAARQCDFNSHFGTSRLDYAVKKRPHLELQKRRCHMAAGDALTYLPPEKRHPFCTYFAAKSAQKKNPLAEVKPFYHIREDLSSFFLIFFKILI